MEWRRDTFSVGGACAGRMYIVGIDAGAHDGFESCKGIAAFRPPSFVRGQVAGNNMRERSRPRKRTEVSAATQVGVHIDHLFLTKVRVPVGGVFVCWARRMASHCSRSVRSQYSFPIPPTFGSSPRGPTESARSEILDESLLLPLRHRRRRGLLRVSNYSPFPRQ